MQRQICPQVPPERVTQHALETMSNGYSCWAELRLPDLIYSNQKHIHPFPTLLFIKSAVQHLQRVMSQLLHMTRVGIQAVTGNSAWNKNSLLNEL